MTPSSSSNADDEGKRKRSSSGACASDGGDQQGPSSKWRTPRAQQAYSSKLLQALRLVRGGGTGTGTGTPTTCSAPAVRDAAYRALAVAARGRSRWSRAILARSRRCRALRCLRARRPPPSMPRRRRHQHKDGEERGLGGRAKVLARLVPGCRSLSLPALLAEVSDYIAALEMQVRAMGQLTQDLASASKAAPSIAPP